MRSYLLPVVLTLALVLAACEPAPPEEAVLAAPTQAEIEAAVDEAVEARVSACNAGDAPAAAALFTDDAVFMPPNAPSAVGKEAIQSWYQTLFDQFTFQLTISRAEAEVADDWAFARGTYTLKLAPKAGGEATEDTGKGLTIWKPQPDGSWKIAREIWNSDEPLPGTAE